MLQECQEDFRGDASALGLFPEQTQNVPQPSNGHCFAMDFLSRCFHLWNHLLEVPYHLAFDHSHIVQPDLVLDGPLLLNGPLEDLCNSQH